MLKIEITADPVRDGVPHSETVKNALEAIGFAPVGAAVPASFVSSADVPHVVAGGQPPEPAKADEPKRRGRPAKDKDEPAKAAEPLKEEPAPQISAQPENRTDPAAEKEEDPFADAPPKKITHDDIRKASGVYINRYGMDAAKEDLAECLAPYGKVALIPDDQDALSKVLAAFNTKIEKNPHNRAVVQAAAS